MKLARGVVVKRISLAEFAKGKSQEEVGQLLGGLTQAAISKMLDSQRVIYIERHPDGKWHAIEERDISKH